MEAFQLKPGRKVQLFVAALRVVEKHVCRQTGGYDGSIEGALVDDGNNMVAAVHSIMAAFLEKALEALGVLLVNFTPRFEHIKLDICRTSEFIVLLRS
jgi:hypothetical protein